MRDLIFVQSTLPSRRGLAPASNSLPTRLQADRAMLAAMTAYHEKLAGTGGLNAGHTMIQVASRAEAMEWARRATPNESGSSCNRTGHLTRALPRMQQPIRRWNGSRRFAIPTGLRDGQISCSGTHGAHVPS
ncbi:MAG: hypothetical protein KGL51_10070 [Betaproteobacteria bacterium]|nr:hypothetical protein [Betaproteobacteria bacterium]MDE2124329.1 hypothetical protein [Betaproteobacteria bacterium]MDE2186204.1 hypothetical protein [Betaproteobacteria bacterium]MDE2324998.1 hypothetical protein [Betaproteobacteria bacterium]